MGLRLFGPIHDGLGKALNLRQQLHSLSVSNLANADTPRYRARVMHFREAMEQVSELQEGAHLASPVDPNFRSGTPEPRIERAPAPAWAMDGNGVNVERESAVLAYNQVSYAGTVEALSRKLGLIKYASSDRG